MAKRKRTNPTSKDKKPRTTKKKDVVGKLLSVDDLKLVAGGITIRCVTPPPGSCD